MRATGLLGAICLSLFGCGDQEAPEYSALAYADHPKAGLYTPGSKIGYQAPSAPGQVDGGSGLGDGDLRAVEDAIAQGDAEDRCAPIEGSEGSEGMLTFEFESDTYDGFYKPENCGAVWIEDQDGKYVATPVIWAGIRRRNLFIWDARRCKDGPPADMISSATLSDHSKRHQASWGGITHEGKRAPDGSYVLNIEVTEDELNYGRRGEFPFEWGGEAKNYSPEDTESVLGLKMTFTPAE